MGNRTGWRVVLVAVALLMAACEVERPAFVLTSTGRILGFDTAEPTRIDSDVRVSGLDTGESLVQLDFRPETQQFFGVTSKGRLCVVDPRTGAARPLATTAFTSETLVNPVADFNPVADSLRLIASQQNLRVNPDDGSLTATDTDAAYSRDDANRDVTPQLAALAYDRNRSDATATTLFALDVATQSLVRVGSRNGAPDAPGTGRLFTIARVGVGFTANAGFDIEPDGETAFAVLAPSGSGAALYRIDLATGAADLVGTLDDGDRSVISLAVGLEEAQSTGGN